MLNKNFYKGLDFVIERAILAEDLKLPTGDPIENFKDVNAKFYIPVLTPMISNESAFDNKKPKPSRKGNRGESLDLSTYIESNYVSLVIPKYILLEFAHEKKIPAKTEFLMCSVGGNLKVEFYRIIGLYSTNATNTLKISKGGSRTIDE